MIDLPTLRAFLGLEDDDTEDDVLLADTIEPAAVAIVQTHTGYTYSATGNVVEYARGTGTADLYLEATAAGDPTSIIERADVGDEGTAITAAQSDGWVRRGNRLVRKAGVWTHGHEYAITYPAGYATDAEPALIRMAVMRIVAALYRQRGHEGLRSEAIGPYTANPNSDAIRDILNDLPRRGVFA